MGVPSLRSTGRCAGERVADRAGHEPVEVQVAAAVEVAAARDDDRQVVRVRVGLRDQVGAALRDVVGVAARGAAGPRGRGGPAACRTPCRTTRPRCATAGRCAGRRRAAPTCPRRSSGTCRAGCAARARRSSARRGGRPRRSRARRARARAGRRRGRRRAPVTQRARSPLRLEQRVRHEVADEGDDAGALGDCSAGTSHEPRRPVAAGDEHRSILPEVAHAALRAPLARHSSKVVRDVVERRGGRGRGSSRSRSVPLGDRGRWSRGRRRRGARCRA